MILFSAAIGVHVNSIVHICTYRLFCYIFSTDAFEDSVRILRADLIHGSFDHVKNMYPRILGKFLSELTYHGSSHGTETDEPHIVVLGGCHFAVVSAAEGRTRGRPNLNMNAKKIVNMLQTEIIYKQAIRSLHGNIRRSREI